MGQNSGSDLRKIFEHLSGKKQTNNRAEIYAAICALKTINSNIDIVINTDSTYIIYSYNSDLPK
ncbi:11868_t:CDS:2, partial [Dentiscutata heterogama]